MTKDISLGLGVSIIIISYIIGNVTDNFGSWLYYKIGCKIWGSPYPPNPHPHLSRPQQRALVREYSPENFNALRTWKVLKTMSHNLSFAMLLISFTAIVQLLQHPTIQWAMISVVSIIAAIILLNRASNYDKWHYRDMLETVKVLQLEKKVDSVPAKKSKKTD